ncbi:MEDS domain-containing protein [Natrinema amylolyticum]|uniref:MEDS domain-containing protein n=1 Tax=Natrinema amylolyticum TaxID=2878679 RepID=UPI001CFB9F40|nr:MEDS domain-containing protein [Natrinema amylolyticum]
MSQPADRSDQPGGTGSGGELEALRQNSAVRGPLEPLSDRERSLTDHDHPTNHLALIYENSDERFAAVVPFIREGIERGERCLYIVDDGSRDEVLAALRDGGVDVDAALDTGQLSIRAAEETYLTGGEFDTDETRTLLETAVAEGLDEYEGVRVTAEETWLGGDETAQRGFADCEAHVNNLIDGENALALCQYDRTELPTSVIEQAIETHPYLIYDGTVCRNFYYTPPAEFFGPERPSREVDRKLATLVDRTEARVTLRARERYRRELYDVVSDTEASFDEKLADLLALGRDRFGLEIGYFARTDDGAFEIVDAVGPNERIEAGVTDSLADTYCEKLLAAPGPISVTDAAAEGWTDDRAYQRFGLDAYFATTVSVGAEDYGTLCFASETPREREYTDAERTFLDLMGQWLSYELDRRHRERYLRESYEITSDPDRSFDEKLEALLELGCERLGLEMAGLNHLPSWDGEFRLEAGVGFDTGPADESL